MFHGLTMVNFDGQTQNQMMVRPWSDGQTVAGWDTQILTYSRCIFKVIELQLYSLRHFRMIPNSFDCQEQLSRFNKLAKQPESN